MTTAATSLLGLALPVTGELAGTWGDTVNNSITSLLDTAVAGTTTLSTDGDVTLTTTTLAANQARQAIILCSGARTALRTITAPAQSKIYTIINATTGGYSVKLVGVGPTTGVTIVAGESALVAWNGSDFIKVSNTGGSASFTNVTVSGTTTLSGLTASTALALNASKEVVSVTNTGTGNNVLSASPTLTGTVAGASLQLSSLTSGRVTYAGASGLLQDSANLTFDGTNLSLTGTGPIYKVPTAGGSLFDANGNNGIYILGSSNYVATYAGGSEQMRLTSTGLGIGTSSPASKLQVVGESRFTNSSNAGVAAYYDSLATAGEIAAYNWGGSAWLPLSLNGGSLLFKIQSTTKATLDSSGNLGLGVTPSAWSGYKAVELSNGVALGSYSAGAIPNAYITTNAYNNGSNWIYKISDYASYYNQYSGAHRWYTAASGTAGDAITFTQAMTLDASGNLGVGATSIAASARLELAGGNLRVRNTNNTANSNTTFWNGDYVGAFLWNQSNTSGAVAGIQFVNGSSANGNAGIGGVAESSSPTTSALAFYTGGSGIGGGTVPERARIDSSGNFGIGTSSPDAGAKLTVAGGILTTGSFSGTTGSTAGIDYNGGNQRFFSMGTSGSTKGGYLWIAKGADGSSSSPMTLDSSGNLGLGVTPSAWGSSTPALQFKYNSSIWSNSDNTIQINQNAYFDGTSWKYVNATSLAASNYYQYLGTHIWRTAGAGTAGNPITWTQPMTLDASGNWMNGTTTAIGRATVVGGSTSQLAFHDGNGSNTNYGYLNYGGSSGELTLNANSTGGNTLIRFLTSNSGTNAERARIDSSGNLLVGTTSSSQGADNGNKFIGTGAVWVVNAATNDAFSYYNTSASAYRFYVGAGGTISATNTTISAISDQRFKENIRDLDVGLTAVMALKPRKFDWKAGKGKDIKGDRGFIAQEFEQVFPDLIDEWKDPAPEGEEPYKSVRQDLIPVLVKAIQELKAEFDAYKASHP